MELDKIVAEKWTGPAIRRWITVEGCMLPERYEELKSEYDNFEVHNDDIFVCTFPKSGTTWAQEMVWLILNNLDFDGAKQRLSIRSPLLELLTAFDFRGFNDVDQTIPTLIEDSLSEIKNRKSFTCIKTHFPWPLQPIQIREGIKKPKMVYVARDPRDVCVSFYHFSKISHNFTVTFDEYVELFLAGKVYYGRYWDHVLPFWKMRHQPNFLFLRYEDMKKDLKQVIRDVATFLQRSLSYEDIEKLSKHLSFGSMRENPSVNYEFSLTFLKNTLGIDDDGKFMRKGIIGDYKNVMSPETIARFDEWIAKNIEGTDYVI